MYASGGSLTIRVAGSNGGGLVGRLRGAITASYATASVNTTGSATNLFIGGLAGRRDGGTITASYAAGAVSSAVTLTNIGGLVGLSEGGSGAITNSYCSAATGQTNCIGALASGSASVSSTRYTAADMQAPTGYTGIYTHWNLDLDGVTGNDDPWDFGAIYQYPVLKFGRDAATIAAQFAAQPPDLDIDIDADGTADLTDAIMVILYLFGLENEGITGYILFSQQATRTDPQAVTAYIETLITTGRIDIDADGTVDLTDAIMVILYLFGLENEGITNYILFSQQATRTDPQAITAYIETLITTGRIDIDADGTVDLTDIIMVILYLFGLENEGITNYILFSQQATRTDPQDVTDYIASLLP